jgi:RNA polymerase sigma-70 factor, ECF subfamily
MKSHAASIPRTDAGDDRDRTLIAGIAAGDQAAFREIHSRYYRRVAFFTRGITRCHELAEEITNDTLLIIWRSARRFKGASRVSTWIMGIARRVSMMSLRTVRRHRAHEESMPDLIDKTYEPWSETEVREWVRAALALLPKEQQTVLELSYGLGHSCKEIADGTNCPLNTVKTRMYYGRRKLKLLLPTLAGSDERSGRDSPPRH